MEVGEVPKGIRWSAKVGGPPKVRIGGARTEGGVVTIKGAFYCGTPASAADIGLRPRLAALPYRAVCHWPHVAPL